MYSIERMQKYLPGYGTNYGHGHVWARPDGFTAKCGGPKFCRHCATDEELMQQAMTWVGRDVSLEESKPGDVFYIPDPGPSETVSIPAPPFTEEQLRIINEMMDEKFAALTEAVDKLTAAIVETTKLSRTEVHGNHKIHVFGAVSEPIKSSTGLWARCCSKEAQFCECDNPSIIPVETK